MSASAGIEGPPLRRVLGQRACPGALNVLLGAGALHFGVCPSLMNNGAGTAADAGASPLNSARWLRDVAQRFRDDPP